MSKVTAVQIRAALRDRYRQPEWALLFEVLNSTGAAHTRSADAIAMSLWPSRGLELWGMEIKVYRADWLKERADPTKAESIAKYCDRWWLVTGPGVVADSSEIPPAWGWMECDGKKITTIREAMKTEAAPMDRRFLAALLRNNGKVDDGLITAEVEKRMAVFNERRDADIAAAVERRTRDATEVLKDVEAFEKEAGIKLASMRGWVSDAAEIGRAVAFIRKAGLVNMWSNVHTLVDALRKKADEIDEAAQEAGLQPIERPDHPLYPRSKRKPQ